MRIALLSPFTMPDTGNWVTSERIKKGLAERGVNVKLIRFQYEGSYSFKRELSLLKSYKPDILHFFNGVKCSMIFDLCRKEINTGTVVTATGTDIFTSSGDEAEIFSKVLKSAGAVTVFHENIKKRLKKTFKIPSDKIEVVPQSVLPDFCNTDIAAGEGKYPLFFLPAGIREVKNLISPLKPVSAYAGEFKKFKLVFAGPVLDKSYFKLFVKELKNYSFAEYKGQIPHNNLPEYYKRCWAVLNTSLSEGGMSNSLLEGMYFKKPLLARKIEGNATIVKDGFNGFTFENEEEFIEKSRLLLASKGLRETLGKNGHDMLISEFSFDREIDGYLSVYRKCIT